MYYSQVLVCTSPDGARLGDYMVIHSDGDYVYLHH